MSETTEPPDPRLGQEVGNYKLIAVIAHGGSGTVYRAESPDGTVIAVKVLDSDVGDRVDPRRFEREAAIRIDHPNVIHVIEAGLHEGKPWIALELLDGEPLSKRLNRGVLSAAEVVDLGVQVCRGLEAAHAIGIVHRDIKPSNLFCCRDGVIKILDFGIALLDPQATRMTTTGKVLGTPGYLSPEQAGGRRDLDPRVDIWGIGAVLYEALAAIAPFERDTLISTVFAIMREELRPLSSMSDAPASLAAVIERCLEKDRSRRWPSATDLRTALEEADLTKPEHRDRPSMPPDEQRVVAILLAESVGDGAGLRRAVEQQGGTYIEMVADRAIGLFGGASWEGDELERAAAAAVAAQGTARHLSVATGHATSQNGALTGAVVDTAEESVRARVNGVALDGRSARILTQSYAVEPASDGFFRIVRKHATTPLPPRGTGGTLRLAGIAAPVVASPLIGRAAEIAQMHDAVRALVEDRRSMAVLVLGPTGIGKTALRREMERLLRGAEPPVRILQGRAHPLGRRAALSLLTDALRRRARVGALEDGWGSLDAEADAEERRRGVEALAREALADDELVREYGPFLGELLGVAMPESTDMTLAQSDSQLMADRLRLALRDYFAGLCQKGPVAFSIEDLHWADGASLDVIEDVLGHLADQPFLLFATAEPHIEELRPSFLSGRRVVRIRPRGLGARDIADLARTVAGKELPEAVLASLVDRTGGNPLFVEQIVRQLEESDLLEAPPSELPIPLTVEAAVQSRLDHLPLLEKSLLKRAAVLDRPFTDEEMAGLGVADARGLLESLSRRGILTSRAQERGSRRREYRFRSRLISEVAYKMIADDARAELHRRAAVMLGGSWQPDDEEIAFHHERGGETDQAADHYALAAVAAGRRGDGDTVLRCTDRVLELGAHQSSRYALHEARGHALHYMGRFDEQEREIGLALAHSANVAARLRVLGDRVECLLCAGEVGAAEDAAQDLLAAARAAQDVDAETIALARLCRAQITGGKRTEAEATQLEARRREPGAGAPARAQVAMAGGAVAEAAGRLGQARPFYETAATLFREAGDVRSATFAELCLAGIALRTAAPGGTEDVLRDLGDRSRRVGHRMAEVLASIWSARAIAREGRDKDARDVLVRALELLDETEARPLRILATLALLRLMLRADDVGDTAEQAERLAAEAGRLGLAELRAHALTIAARAHLRSGDAAGALQSSETALGIRDSIGGLAWDEADVFTVHADALAATGDEAAAAKIRARLQQLAP